MEEQIKLEVFLEDLPGTTEQPTSDLSNATQTMQEYPTRKMDIKIEYTDHSITKQKEICNQSQDLLFKSDDSYVTFGTILTEKVDIKDEIDQGPENPPIEHSNEVKIARKKYTKEALAQALDAVRNKTMTAYKAAKEYHIPKQTLLDKLKNKYTKQSAPGAPTVLTPAEEELIVKWVQQLAEVGFPITKHQLIHSVGKLIEVLNRPNNFKNGLPGRHWYERFLKRNPSIIQRVSQTLTTAPASVDEEKIRAWFQRVRTYLQQKGWLEILEDPTRIFNCEESAFYLCPEGQGVLVRKGAEQEYGRSGNDDKMSLTVSIGGSADGKLMPVFALFPYERIPHNVLTKYPKNWAIGKSDSGWITCDSFYEYVTNIFHPFLLKENITRPVILFLDGHTSHLSLRLCEFCKDNGIVLIALLPNSTHLMQPMDVAVFRCLEDDWRKRINSWRMKNNGHSIKREEFDTILEDCITTTIKPEMIKNGFRACGLHPFDSNALDYSNILKYSARSTSTGISSPSNVDFLKKPQSTNVNHLFLRVFEENIGSNKLEGFRRCEGDWIGDIRDENLYYFWKKIQGKLKDENDGDTCSFVIGNSTFEANRCTETLTNIIIDWSQSNNTTVTDMQENGSFITSTPVSKSIHAVSNQPVSQTIETPNSNLQLTDLVTSTNDLSNGCEMEKRKTPQLPQHGDDGYTSQELRLPADTTIVLPTLLGENKTPPTTIKSPEETVENDSKKTSFPTSFKNALFWPETNTKKTVKRKLTSALAIADEYNRISTISKNRKKGKAKKEEIKSEKGQ